MFKLDDRYRIIRRVHDNIFDDIYEIDSIATLNKISRHHKPHDPTYTVVFSKQKGVGVLQVTHSLCAEYREGMWIDPTDLDAYPLDWQITKIDTKEK